MLTPGGSARRYAPVRTSGRQASKIKSGGVLSSSNTATTTRGEWEEGSSMSTNQEAIVAVPGTLTQRRSMTGDSRTLTALSTTSSSGSSGSSTSLERRPSRMQARYALSKRSSRVLGGDDAHLSTIPSRSSTVGTDSPAPSATVLRLRALARAVRAGQALGRDTAQDRRQQYLAKSSRSPSSFTPRGNRGGSDDDNDDLNFALSSRASILRESDSISKRGGLNVLDQGGGSGRPLSSGTARGKVIGPTKAPPELLSHPSIGKQNGKSNPKGEESGSAGEHKGSLNTTLQRLGSIRGDLSALLNAFNPQVAAGNAKTPSDAPPSASLQLANNLDARLCCARSLYKLSCESGGEAAVVRGGAITQIAEFSDMEDPRLLRYAGATLANLTATESLTVLEDFVKLDGASALLELSWTPSIDVKLLCTTALCRLTQHAVFAALLVRARAMNELSAMLAIPHPRLQFLVVSCILNLVHHGTVLPDKVFLGDPHALQNPLGVLSVVSQQAVVPASSAFAVEVLFNLSLKRSYCSVALRGGGADVLHGLAVHVTKAVEALALSNPDRVDVEVNMGKEPTRRAHSLPPSPWMTNRDALLKLLRLIAATLANFSAMSEYHAVLSGYGMKTLATLLFAPLRELRTGSASSHHDGKGDSIRRNSSVGTGNAGEADESTSDSDDGTKSEHVHPGHRIRAVAVSCSRALANFASNAEFRRHAFQEDVVRIVVWLTLIDHSVLPPAVPVDVDGSEDEGEAWTPRRAFSRNIVRVLTNLSFEEACTGYFMESPHVLQLLHAIAVHPSPCCANGATASRAAISPSRTSPTYPFRFWLTHSVVCEEMKEDALVAILNLARQPAYAGPLLRTLDGKKLAQAAEEASGHSTSLRYLYALVLSNLLFQSNLQQIVFGDQAMAALVYAFHYSRRPEIETTSDRGISFDHDEGLGQRRTNAADDGLSRLYALHLASDDDRERFLASILMVASELMGMNNIDRVVRLVSDCLQAHLDMISPSSAASLQSSTALQYRALLKRQHPISCYAAATLHAMARSATQRGDRKSVVFSEEIVTLLLRVCAASPKCSGASLIGDKESRRVNGGSSSMAITMTSQATSSPMMDPPKNGPSLSKYCGMTQAFCASTLYHLCVAAGSGGKVDARIVQGLIDCCNDHEEIQSLLACSASFAIISFSQDGCRLLIQCDHLARALNRLGRSSHVESQLYAAITACNVSALQCVWSSAELRDFIVVALLRANSVQAKQIHAKTLSNLLSHVQIRPQIIEDGVLYALMKLSQVLLSSGESGASIKSVGVTKAEVSASSRNLSSPFGSASGGFPTATPITSTTVELLSIGLQALFNLSCEHIYHPKLLSNGVMAYLSTVVAARQHTQHLQIQSAGEGPASSSHPSLLRTNSISSSITTPSTGTTSAPKHRGTDGKASPRRSFGSSVSVNREAHAASTIVNEDAVTHLSVESQRFVLGIVCNLASFEENHQELMSAHVSTIIRKCVDPRDVEARASAAMALLNLSCRMPWVEMLCERKTLQLLLALAESSNGQAIVRQYATQAVANCSLVTDSLHLFAERKVPRAVLSLLEKATVEQKGSQKEASGGDGVESSIVFETYMAALKCIRNIALDDALALQLVDESVVLRLVQLFEYRSIGANEEACELVATMVKTLAGKSRCAEALLRQRVVSLCALLHRKHPESVVLATDCVHIIMTLSTCQQIQSALVETQAIHVVVSICSSPLAQIHTRLRDFGAITIRNLTLSATEHLALFYGTSTLETDADIFAEADGEGDSSSASNPSRNQKESASRSSSPRRRDSNGMDEYESGEYDSEIRASGDRVSVSRLTERHLFFGLKYFQQEIASGCASDRVLLEACTAMANMSTVHAFRPAMVRAGMVSTLLTVHMLEASHIRKQTADTGEDEHALTKRICAATLHRLVTTDGGAASVAGSDRNALMPSLLAVLQLTDEELHQVRYECEKVSVYAPQAQFARRPSLVQSVPAGDMKRAGTRRWGSGASPSAGAAGATGGAAASLFMPTMMVQAVTQCVKNTSRGQKWTVYVIKTTLSSQSMVPQLEKQQLRAIGRPRLSFQDAIDAGGSDHAGDLGSGRTSAVAIDSKGEQSTSSSLGARVETERGYLLSVAMDKYLIERDRDGNESVVSASGAKESINSTSAGGGGSRRSSSIELGAVTTASDLSSQAADDVDSIIHQRKFDRHMRISRRNLRRNPGDSGISGVGANGGVLPPMQHG